MKLGLELAFEPALTRVQVLELQVQALMQVAELARLEPQVQAQAQALLQVAELAQVQARLELEQHLQRSHPKPQLHRHRCKGPDHSQEPQLELRQTQVHPKALDMTPRVLELAQVPQVRQELVLELAQAPELEQVQERAAQLAQELEPGLHVFLARLPLQQDLTRHI